MTARTLATIVGLALGLAMRLATPALGQTLTADLSSHVIGITTGFVGADLVLFGSIVLPRAPSADRPADIVAVVRGPESDVVVRRKERIAGLWINGSRVVFHEAPGFFAVAASRPLADIAAPDLMARHAIGLDAIRLQPAEPVDADRLGEFRTALIEAEKSAGLYRPDVATVSFIGGHLFRADMVFPANVPTGNYSVEIFLFVDGQLAAAQTTPLVVSRIGFSNGVVSAAHHHAAFYGVAALIFAVAAGWAAGAVFRRI